MDENSFYSLDKLMEFGMGLGVAQQMMGVMNKTLNEMQVPNAGMAIGYKKPGFFTMVGDKPAGPLTDEELQALIYADKINADSFVWKEGMPGWKQVKNVPEVYKYVILRNAQK